MASLDTKENIVWMDMEMSGLNPDVDKILEIACMVTDKNLKKLSKVYKLVINQPQSVFSGMDDWCKKHHKKSGLIKESLESTITIKDAENRLLNFLQNYTSPGLSPLAGNTVYMDKLFLMKHLPRVANHLHYRIIDVSSLGEICRRWYPNFKYMKKSLLHRAAPDIVESLEELKFFRNKYFIPVPKENPDDNSDPLLDMIGS